MTRAPEPQSWPTDEPDDRPLLLSCLRLLEHRRDAITGREHAWVDLAADGLIAELRVRLGITDDREFRASAHGEARG